MREPIVDELRFVTCFCEGGDLLGMWRGYAANGGGFSLGFSGKDISRLGIREADAGDHMLARVIYGDAVLSHPEANMIQEMLVAAAQAPTPLWASLIGAFLAPQFTNLVIRSKNAAFSEEREWRIMIRHTVEDTCIPLVAFRRGANDIKPYIALSYPKTGDMGGQTLLPLEEITVGPTLRPEPTVRALRLLLHKYGYSDQVVIKVTQVPYQL